MPASIAPTLDADLALRLAEVALRNVGTEYPYHLVHMVRVAADVRAPRDLFPVFWGSYDWHSCVHMHWTLARCLRHQATAVRSGPQAAACTSRSAPPASPPG